MDREQAVKYLQSSGFSEEQIKAIEGAFTCDKCVYSTSEGCQYDDITETIPPFETSDNAISRQAVMDCFKKWQPYMATRLWEFEQELSALPSVGSSENPNKCEDAVSRQAAIDAIYARYIGGKEAVDKAPANDQYAEGIDEAVCAVEDLPPVTPQPKDNIKGFYEIAGNLTNGDVIKALFPEVKVEIDGFLVRCVFIEHEFTTTEDWWNAPYKKAERSGEK